MDSARFDPAALTGFAEAYPAAPVKIRHRLTSDALLSLDALAELAEELPSASVEYNIGDLPLGVVPGDLSRPDCSAAEAIRRIAHSGSWVVLKRVEQHPAYAALLHEVLGELHEIAAARTGAMEGCEGFIFISSPHAVTPLHFDPEHNVLLQLAGEKSVTVFPAEDEAIAPPEVHEKFHLGTHHRNLDWDEAFHDRGTRYVLGPGEGLHIPVKAPHYVRNGEAPSVSLSVTWRSTWSYAEADARAFNHVLRGLGLEPRRPAPFPSRNLPKSLAYRAIRRSGLVRTP